jgi:DHA1 family tetracycline resistance protein-like MFS transporter
MTLHNPQKRKISLAAVFFTFFIDNLSWAVVFPIFAPYFLDPKNAMFSADVSIATRTTILGFFLMAFSLGQFLGAPVLGEYADRNGRKKALVLSVLFTLIGLALSAWSMGTNSLIWLFIARLITGVFAGNMSICLACVSDLSEDEAHKAKNFGYLSVIAGLSFVLGAFFGGKFADSTISPSFTPNFPLWIAAGMTALNLAFIWFGFKETSHVDHTVKFDFLEGIHNIQKALKTEKIKRMYAIYFLFLFAWTILFQFAPVLFVSEFSFTSSNIGDLALFMGICWAIGSGYLNKMLVRFFAPLRVLECALLAFTLLCGLIIFPKEIYGVIAILGACVALGGLAWPLCTTLISNTAPRDIQGKILGMSQSVQSLAMSIAPLVGGMAFQASLGLPFLIGAGASLLAGIIYFTLKDR